MKTLLFVTCAVLVLKEIVAPPPRRSDKKEEIKENSETVGLDGIEYERYLREVIDVLESDPEFKRKLEQAEEVDIRTGKIAHELSYVDHNVRSKLDEIKRAELERLRHFAQKQYELSNGIDVDHLKILPPEHLDHGNPHTFEIDDLKKLINKVTHDLNEADKKRREEFKEYEMQKEFENNEKIKHLEGNEKEAFEKQLKDNETKHKQHEPLHHPGSKQQLEEVWEKQDHMQQEFNPKVFFQLHDIDGNGFWDQNEVKALFIKELDKMYQAGAPEDDMRERAEELERMREHVFRESDRNGDQLISYEEFLEQTKKPEFEKDPSWETIDQQPVYTHEEYQEFERRRMEEIQHMVNQGLIPPQAVYQVPPGYHHPGMQQYPPGQHPQQFQQHPNQQQFQQHPNQQQLHPNQQQFQQQHLNQQQFQQHPGQQQQFQQHPGQQQQFQQHPGQQQFQQQHPSDQFQQQQHHPNQPEAHPSQQLHPGQQQAQQQHNQPPPNPNQHHNQPPPPPPPGSNEHHQNQQYQPPPPSQLHPNQQPPPSQHFQQPPNPNQQYQQPPPPPPSQQFQQHPNQQYQQPPPAPPQNQQFQQQAHPNEIKRQPLGDSGHAQFKQPENAHPNSINGNPKP